MERQIRLKNLVTIVLLAFILCLGMAIMTDQVFAQGSMATVNANGTIKEVNSHEDWLEALELIDDLGQDTWAEISLHSDITERVPELDSYRIQMTINLNGYTWTINDDTSMQTYRSITINGGGGTITIAEGVYPSGLFCTYASDIGTSINVNDTNFVDCKCGRYPLFYIVNKNDYLSPGASFKNCTFTNCSSTAFGGVLYGYFMKGGVYTTNCTFDNCHSKYGGVYYLEDTLKEENYTSNVSIYGFVDNVTTYNNCKADTAGGVLYLDNSHISFRTQGKLEISNCSAPNGGVIYCDKYSKLSFGTEGSYAEINVSDCTATGNGGFCYSEGTVYINWSTIYDCSAQNGGVLYMNGNNNGRFNDNTIYNCTATGVGGVLYCSDYDETTFKSYDNTYTNAENSNQDGSLIYCENAILSSERDTINSSNSRAIYNGGSFIGDSTGSILSSGSLWIVTAIAGIVVGFVGGMFFAKKKTTANGN